MSKIGVGIIGCGNISTAYLTFGPRFAALDIRAVADLNPAAAAAQAAKFGIRSEPVDALLAAPDIDVIVNLTIPAAHFAVNKRILEAGKHAYSEKPFVLTLEQAETLRQIATARDLRVGSAPDTFLGGAHQLARAVIDEGRIGRIVGGTAHVMSRGMEHWHPNPDFFFQPGAGPILDIGPYYITNLIQLLGPVACVTGMASTARPARTIGTGPRKGETVPVATPTTLHALLEFRSGAVVTLGASWDVQAHDHRPMELYGETGTLYVPDPNFFGGAVLHATADQPALPIAPQAHPFGVPNQIHGDRAMANYRCAGLADMVSALEDGRPHRCNLDLAVHAVEVMTGILEAGAERRFVEMTTHCARPAPLSPKDARALLAEDVG